MKKFLFLLFVSLASALLVGCEYDSAICAEDSSVAPVETKRVLVYQDSTFSYVDCVASKENLGSSYEFSDNYLKATTLPVVVKRNAGNIFLRNKLFMSQTVIVGNQRWTVGHVFFDPDCEFSEGEDVWDVAPLYQRKQAMELVADPRNIREAASHPDYYSVSDWRLPTENDVYTLWSYTYDLPRWQSYLSICDWLDFSPTGMISKRISYTFYKAEFDMCWLSTERVLEGYPEPLSLQMQMNNHFLGVSEASTDVDSLYAAVRLVQDVSYE